MECLSAVILATNVIILKIHYLDKTVQVPALLAKWKKQNNRIASRKISVTPIVESEATEEAPKEKSQTPDVIINENQWHYIAKQLNFYIFAFVIVFVCFATLLLIFLLL